MDRKPRVDNKGGKKSNEKNETSAKDEALDKLRKMEYLRNKQDSWHLSRSRYEVQERKKDEDNYFEGTSREKNKRNRKPRYDDSSQSGLPSGFSVSGTTGPPPVNAWAQKKGSALFEKPPEEIDDEDEMLKLALRESMKTAQEEEKKKFEKLRYYNVEATTKSKGPVEQEWAGHFENNYSTQAYQFDKQKKTPEYEYDEEVEEEEVEDIVSSKKLVFEKEVKKPDLQFVETDLAEESNFPNSRRKPLPRPRKSSSPLDNSCKVEDNRMEKPSTRPSQQRKPVPQSYNDPSNDIFEPSRPFDKLNTTYNTCYDVSKPQLAYNQTVNKETKQSTVVPKTDRYLDDLATNLNSTLTFGDTQEVLDDSQLRDILYNRKEETLNNNDGSSVYQDTAKTDPEPDMKPVTRSEQTTFSLPFSLPSEPNFLLQNFIRHDPSSSVGPKVDMFDTKEKSELFTNPQQLFPSEPISFQQQQPLANGPVSNSSQSALLNTNTEDSYSSLSNSPLQNNSPYGSFDKQFPSNIASWGLQPQATQLPMQFPMNLQGNQDSAKNLQGTQTTNTNVSQAPYANLPGLPNYVAPNVPLGLPLNPQLPMLPQYQMPISNAMMQPSLQNQDLLNQSTYYYQAQMQQQQQQQYQLALMKLMQQQQYQQQLGAQQQQQLGSLGLNAPENLVESLQKEQTNALGFGLLSQPAQNLNQSQMVRPENQSQLLGQTIQSLNQPQTTGISSHPQMLNQQQMMPQMLMQHPSNQQLPQSQAQLPIPKQDLTVEKDEIPQEQQINGNQEAQQIKTKQDMLLEYQEIMQKAQLLQQQMLAQEFKPQAQPQQSMMFPQPFMMPQPIAVNVGGGNYYPGVPNFAQVQQSPNQVMSSVGHVSLTDQQGISSTPMFTVPDVNAPVLQTAAEPRTGRGRGRIQ